MKYVHLYSTSMYRSLPIVKLAFWNVYDSMRLLATRFSRRQVRLVGTGQQIDSFVDLRPFEQMVKLCSTLWPKTLFPIVSYRTQLHSGYGPGLGGLLLRLGILLLCGPEGVVSLDTGAIRE